MEMIDREADGSDSLEVSLDEIMSVDLKYDSNQYRAS